MNEAQISAFIKFNWTEAHPRLLDAALWLLRNKRSHEILPVISLDPEYVPFPNEPTEGYIERLIRSVVPASSALAKMVGLYELPTDIPVPEPLRNTTFNLAWRILR